MMFRDYESTFAEGRRLRKENRELARVMDELHPDVDFSDYKSVYKLEIKKTAELLGSESLPFFRMCGELVWYLEKRPFFNVYPLIERKLYELDENVKMSELSLPYKALEIRTHNRTMLATDCGDAFGMIVEIGEGYQEFLIPKISTFTIHDIINGGYHQEDSKHFFEPLGYGLDEEQRATCIMLLAGTCMLARDKSIVMPVVLNQHRKENMTPAEIAAYAEKAISRTGRVGFDVGRNIERMKASVHYRNGCFSKYYIGKDHEQYPPNAELSKVPIIKWRCGSIVNRDNLPKVPTGFKDHQTA